MARMSNSCTPRAIRVEKGRRRVRIEWSDGAVHHYDFDALRKECPCADCKGHTPDQAKVIECEGIGLTGMAPVGNYALAISFDDGHATGIYTYDYLRERVPRLEAADD